MKYKDVLKFIRRHGSFILTTHETPDGDAIGSEYAMFRALVSLGKQARIINSDPTPKNFSFVDLGDSIEELTTPAILPKDLENYVLLILDVNDIKNIGTVAHYVLPQVQKAITGWKWILKPSSAEVSLCGRLTAQCSVWRKVA